MKIKLYLRDMKTLNIIKNITRLNFYSRINHVPSKLKNTFKVLAFVLTLSSCEKAAELSPIEYDDKTRVNIFADSCVVNINIDGEFHQFGSFDTQSAKLIELDDFKYITVYRLFGKRFETTVTRGSKQINYGFSDFVNYEKK